jgi:hypothetical protein
MNKRGFIASIYGIDNKFGLSLASRKEFSQANCEINLNLNNYGKYLIFTP